jgi:hypothetical protein
MAFDPLHGPIYVVERRGSVRVYETLSDAHAQIEPTLVEDDAIEAVVDAEGHVFGVEVVELPAPAGRLLFGHHGDRRLRSVRLKPRPHDPLAPEYLRKVLARAGGRR